MSQNVKTLRRLTVEHRNGVTLGLPIDAARQRSGPRGSVVISSSPDLAHSFRSAPPYSRAVPGLTSDRRRSRRPDDDRGEFDLSAGVLVTAPDCSTHGAISYTQPGSGVLSLISAWPSDFSTAIWWRNRDSIVLITLGTIFILQGAKPG